MESNQESTRIKFIKALEECDDFYLSSDQYCILEGKLDPVEYGHQLEATFQLAISDLRSVQLKIINTMALLDEADIRRDELQKKLQEMTEQESNIQESLKRIVKSREIL